MRSGTIIQWIVGVTAVVGGAIYYFGGQHEMESRELVLDDYYWSQAELTKDWERLQYYVGGTWSGTASLSSGCQHELWVKHNREGVFYKYQNFCDCKYKNLLKEPWFKDLWLKINYLESKGVMEAVKQYGEKEGKKYFDKMVEMKKDMELRSKPIEDSCWETFVPRT